MKTICILLQNHYDSDIRVRRKAEALIAAGYEVDVIALRSERNSPANYQLKGVNVYTFALGKKRGSLVRYFYEYTAFLIRAYFRLRKLMKTRHYSMVDVNNLPDFLVFAARPAKRKGAKVVFDMHEITPEFYISKYEIKEDSRLVRFLKFIERKSMRFADHVITINEPILQLLAGRGLPLQNSTVIMNAVDEAMFLEVMQLPPRVETEAVKPFVMMYHGTLTKIYGLDIAIEAFGKAAGQMPGAEFWILGQGPERPALEALTEKQGLAGRVKFLGSVPPDDIPRWLHQCDIGVLPTRRDVFLDFSFSNKLSEYIIMKKAVISSSLNAIRHYFSEGSLAYFTPHDSTDLAAQMVRLFENPALRAEFAQKAITEYAPIRWEVMKNRYLDLTARLLSAEPASQSSAPSGVLANSN